MSARPISVLVVDDDWMNREILEAMLKQAGLQVRAANSGEAALSAAHDDPPDVVLLDVRMSGMDGFETCRRLKADNGPTRHTAVIIFTALESDQDRQQAIEAGADDFLTKPFNTLLMVNRLRSLARIRRLHQRVEQQADALGRVLARHVSPETTRTILAELAAELGGADDVL